MEQIIVSGDVVNFLPPFGSAIIVPVPGAMVGSAATVMTTSKPTCVEGDEKKVVVPGVAYINGPHVIPGVGILTIDKLASDQLSTKTTSGGKKVILKGVQFDAKPTCGYLGSTKLLSGLRYSVIPAKAGGALQ